MDKQNDTKLGFTLAEVLITLVIIGVIAAMTVPAVFSNIRHKELESRFKKCHSDLENALRTLKFTEGVNIYGEMNAQNDTILKLLAARFGPPAKVVSRSSSHHLGYKDFDGSEYNAMLLDDGTLIVNDGFYIFFNNDNKFLTNQRFIIDINGQKEPNRHGFDLFQFCLKEGDALDITCDVYTKRAIVEKDYFKNLKN